MNYYEAFAIVEALDDWASYDKYPVEDWKYEVANNDTREGYRDWLLNMLLDEEEE